MLQVVPDYYKEFHCIAGACKHNCCIGWEIDIDADTLKHYDSVSGELGTRLQSCISREDSPHFILAEKDRCPFLNQDNLCDIILMLGEDHICSICAEHPRFHNELPGRIETGLGLCCEEAARLILGKQNQVRLEYHGDTDAEDTILAVRDQVIAVLQDRSKTIPERIASMLALCNAVLPVKTMDEWTTTFLALERLDDAWTKQLEQLRDGADLAAFDAYMCSRQTEYEQLLVYFVYRHLANACDADELAARAGFAAISYELLHQLGAVILKHTGKFDFSDQVELVRMFSSEVEYSEENMACLLDEFYAR